MTKKQYQITEDDISNLASGMLISLNTVLDYLVEDKTREGFEVRLDRDCYLKLMNLLIIKVTAKTVSADNTESAIKQLTALISDKQEAYIELVNQIRKDMR